MERYVVGKCRSGKIITSEPEIDGLKAPQDIFDAMAMLDTLAAREFRRFGDSERVESLWQSARHLKLTLETKGLFSQQMEAIGATSSLDLLRHAQRLLNPEFRA
jgi:hypothetical protein